MIHLRTYAWLLATALFTGCIACKEPFPNPCAVCLDPACDPCAELVANVEYPDVQRCIQTETLQAGPPRKLSDGAFTNFCELTLEEAIRQGLENSRILKDLGGTVLRSPQAVGSVYDPSITMSHPRLGEEAALSAFDAQYQGSLLYNDSNQAFNNTSFGGGANQVASDGFNWNTQLTKTAATGTQFAVGQQLEYENSDAPFNLFPSVYNGSVQASVRQPLLQGAGVGFNRIAGPGNSLDLSTSRGVILARISGDISIAQFERGVRDFVRDIETAYWQLYFAYRSLDATRAGRDATRTTWQTVRARYDADLKGGEADREAQAREQMYQFEQAVTVALNGSPSGGSTGVFLAERRLRRMMGLPVSDDCLFRPVDEPIESPVRFDWHDCLTDALVRRVELREQMWRVKQRELEMIAAKNYLLPRLDAVAALGVTGFGDNLFGGSGGNSNLLRELGSLDNYQSQVGLQFSVPIGYRKELAGVRHAKLNLCRERAVLQDQEHLISHDLGTAFVAVETALESIRLNRSRLDAAEDVIASRLALFDAGKVAIDTLLESQRRLVDAQTQYFQSRADYAIAIRDLHYQKGTLLPFNGVRLSEGPWPSQACQQAWCERKRWIVDQGHEKKTLPCPVTMGTFDDPIDGFGMAEEETVAPFQDASYDATALPTEVPNLHGGFDGLHAESMLTDESIVDPAVPIFELPVPNANELPAPRLEKTDRTEDATDLIDSVLRNKRQREQPLLMQDSVPTAEGLEHKVWGQRSCEP